MIERPSNLGPNAMLGHVWIEIHEGEDEENDMYAVHGLDGSQLFYEWSDSPEEMLKETKGLYGAEKPNEIVTWDGSDKAWLTICESVEAALGCPIETLHVGMTLALLAINGRTIGLIPKGGGLQVVGDSFVILPPDQRESGNR